MEAFIGTIIGWGPPWAPRGWTFCDGRLLPILGYEALFSLLGTTYGGNGETTFALPDLRGRAAVGAGRGPGTANYTQGTFHGSEAVALMPGQMPLHNHPASIETLQAAIPASSGEGTSDLPTAAMVPARLVTNTSRGKHPTKGYTDGANTFLNPGTVMGQIVTDNSGDSQPFEIVQPVLAIQYIICVDGLYPSRN